jgi:hypothetical protein
MQDLQKTILALEKISEESPAGSEQIDELLDQLFQQKIDLAGFSVNETTQAYQQAVQAMSRAAAKAERAVRDAGAIPEMLGVVAHAISGLARVLDRLVPQE